MAILELSYETEALLQEAYQEWVRTFKSLGFNWTLEDIQRGSDGYDDLTEDELTVFNTLLKNKDLCPTCGRRFENTVQYCDWCGDDK